MGHKGTLSIPCLLAVSFILAACDGRPFSPPATQLPTTASEVIPTSTMPTNTAEGNAPTAGPTQPQADLIPPIPVNEQAAQQYQGATIIYYGDSVNPGAELDARLAARFTERTGIKVIIPTDVVKTLNADTRFSLYERLFQAESTEIDVLMLDVIWPGHFAQNLLDLKPRFEDILAQYDADLIQNNTIDGRLIAIPWFQNFGMLYYRSDLLEKYDFQVPETWTELEEQARTIMAGEQASNPTFTGFVWQGATYEGLTCNALEWIYSQGGGTIINKNGEVDINNAEAARALDQARGWVGTISPHEVTSYMEGDALNRFRSGNAAFMRNWPYAYALSNAQDSPIKGKFDIAPLPHGENGRSAGTVGGWQLSVSRYSKSPEASIEFVRYMTSPEVQRWRALVGSYIPTIKALREESAVRESVYALTILPQVDLIVRPSGFANASYPELSRSFFLGVKEILERRDAESILPMVQDRIENRVLSRE